MIRTPRAPFGPPSLVLVGKGAPKIDRRGELTEMPTAWIMLCHTRRIDVDTFSLNEIN